MAKLNMKVIQDFLGHADIGTTMNIYTDATQDLKKKEFAVLSDYMKEQAKKNGKEMTKEDRMIVDVIQVGR